MTSDPLHRLLLDHLNTAVVLLDDALLVDYLNPAAESLVQVSCARLRGTAGCALFSGEDEARMALREALENGHPYTRRHEALRTPGGEQPQVDYTVTPLQWAGRGWLLVEMQPLDRFLRINREEALLSVHDTSRMLIRGLAHEIKNPLGGIRGAAQLLAVEAEESGLPDDALEMCEIISTEVNRLRNLVDRLLGPNQLPKFESLNIHEVTEHVAALLKAEVQGGIELLRDYDPSIPELEGDREQLIQVLLNLVRNAMQSLAESRTPEARIIVRTRIQRHFTIGGRHHKVVCRVDVIDNGPGISEQIAEKIFFPMVSGRSDGSGLGLTIAQAAVQAHHGIIECESEPGNTMLSVFLPLQQQVEEQSLEKT